MLPELVSKSVRVGSFRTHFWEAGPTDAPLVLLVHDGAWGGDAWASWAEVARSLSTRFHVIAPDMLGFGRSQQAIVFDESRYDFRARHLFDLITLVRGEGSFHAVGTSFGGSVVLRAAANPALSGRLLSASSLCATGSSWGRVDENFARLAVYDGSEQSMLEVLELLCADPGRRAVQARHRQENVHRVGNYQAMSAVRIGSLDGVPSPADPAEPYAEMLARSMVPLLLIEGSEDLIYKSGWSREFCEQLGRGIPRTIAGRHSPNIDSPDVVAAVLSEFLESEALNSVAGSPGPT